VEGVDEVALALVVGDVEVGDVEQRGLGDEDAPTVAVDGDDGDGAEAEAVAFLEGDGFVAEGVEVVAAGVDDAHYFDLLFAEVVEGAVLVVVDADLGEAVGFVFAPAPDLGGVYVDEVGAAAHGAFFGQVAGSSCCREIDQDGAVAVGEAADEGAAGVFVDAGADAIDVFGDFAPVGVAFDVDGFAEDGAGGGFDEAAGVGGEDAAVDAGLPGVVVFARFLGKVEIGEIADVVGAVGDGGHYFPVRHHADDFERADEGGFADDCASWGDIGAVDHGKTPILFLFWQRTAGYHFSRFAQ